MSVYGCAQLRATAASHSSTAATAATVPLQHCNCRLQQTADCSHCSKAVSMACPHTAPLLVGGRVLCCAVMLQLSNLSLSLSSSAVLYTGVAAHLSLCTASQRSLSAAATPAQASALSLTLLLCCPQL